MKDWFYINKKKNVYDVFPNRIWDEIKDARSLSFKLEFRVWSLDLERHPTEKEIRPFGKQLQKRWRKYGYLLLDDIVSERIPINLNH
jgi:hypothetical protein